MKKIILLLVCGLFMFSSCKRDKDPDVLAMNELIKRVLPDYTKDIVVEKAAPDSVDYFELASKGDRLIIKGNNANSMAVGLNYYLKYYCKTEFSWFEADTMEMPILLPKIETPVRHQARVSERFFLNYCTYGYTMPWWGWKEWEHFIDWMALNGVNLPLAITGQEAVWYKVWSEMGLSDEEIRSYFTGPAHLPWHRMQNIDRWGGPLPVSWLEDQEALQKQIVARERELNMKPVLPGFAGHVPACITRLYPDAPLTSLGDWAGFDSVCWCKFLDPMSPLYTEIQQKFIQKETELFGTDHIYGIDIFNEMCPSNGDTAYLSRVSRQVYESLASVDPDAQWLQMTWLFHNERYFWNNDRIKAYIKAFPDDKQILLDYYCDRQPVWERTQAYFGVPYIWCYLGNFGGNTMLVGNIDTVNSRIERAFVQGGTNFKGIGSTLEGFDCNPFMYEYIFEKAWDDDLTHSVSDWVDLLADRHAGIEDVDMREAWHLLVDSVYRYPSSPGQAVALNARPSMQLYQYYINPNYHYNNIVLMDVLDGLLKVPSSTDALTFDRVNVCRQLLGNYFTDLYHDYVAAYSAHDSVEMHQSQAIMLSILDDMETLLETRSDFLVGKWIADARAKGKTQEDKDYYESNARNLITTWGDADSDLTEYGSRTWAGMVDTYYGYRWRTFFKDVDEAMRKGQQFSEEAYREKITRYEKEWWSERLGQYNSTPIGDGTVVAAEILERYRQQLEARYRK